jgi:hypothetical protein
MFTYFTCERYSCTMQRRHCIARIGRRAGKFSPIDDGCRRCEQGRENAIACGVLVPGLKRQNRGTRRFIDELAVLS